MAFISKSTIQDVKDRLDALAIVGDYVRLEKKSGRWWGRCPFHAGGQEKTPSFKVDPDLKMYHCFGCDKSGSVISFVMEMEKIAYFDAIKHLANKMGIDIIYEDGKEGDNDHSLKDDFFELYRRTTLTFQHFLTEKPEGKKALDYIIKRGIDSEIITRFKLGYSPANRNFLHEFLKKKGYSDEFLEKSGLFSSNYKTLTIFSGRLMFPISDRQSRVMAFGGRTMPGVLQNDGKEPPKYINSPETEIYKKGQNLYALDLALAEIRKTKTVYVAEGYIDIISLHQAGIVNSVAPLGTAFTEEQAKLLNRWAEKIVFFFDSDEAGVKAAYKAIITCKKNNISCAVISIQDALKKVNDLLQSEVKKPLDYKKCKDPADILYEFGENILKNITNCIINDSEYLISCGKSQYLHKGNGKKQAVIFLFPYLEAIVSEIERDETISLLANIYGVDLSAVKKDYSVWKTGGRSKQETSLIKSTAHLSINMNNELFLLTVVAANMNLYPYFRTVLEIREIDDPAAKELFVAMEECFIHDESDIESLLERIKDETLRKYLSSRGTSAEFKTENIDNENGFIENAENKRSPRKMMEDGINEIKKKRLYKRIQEINIEIRNKERNIIDSSENTDDRNVDEGENFSIKENVDIEENIDIEELLKEKKYLDSQMRNLERRSKNNE